MFIACRNSLLCRNATLVVSTHHRDISIKCYIIMESSTREAALRRRRERERDRRAREAVEERECRLSKRRARDRKRDRRPRETFEERDYRLFNRRARDRKRANECRTSDASAQSDVRLGKRRLQQRDLGCPTGAMALKIAPMNVFERQRPFYGRQVPVK